MRRMGDKVAARATAAQAGVPVAAGAEVPDPDDAAAVVAAADGVGYPLLVKAARGGGGKGIRRVERREELAEAVRRAASEARTSFGDARVYLERFVERPRHVEVQVLVDDHGNAVALGERECSVQRRHQKMIEESPSVAVSPELRRRMGDTAVAAARAAGYVNAGTCEFLLDRQGSFYFLEMNTRLQVEHPVTELVTGIDLVQWQLRVAAGERLPFGQDDITPHGWAIECRITSEDPANGFLPSTGRVAYLRLPGGPGVRWDGGIGIGSEIGLHYDPMLAKLIVWAPTRDAAIARMHRALLELTIDGVATSRDFHLRVMEDPEFQRGQIDIQWLERRLDSLTRVPPPAEGELVAAVAAVLLADRERGTTRVAAPNGATASNGAVSASVAEGWLAAARREALRAR
jgi:acetyl-CoA carboxylase biotin carboxylase subunit